MNITNKEKRIKYLGFDDKWFMICGIIFLSFVTDYMFSRSFVSGIPLIEAIIGWSVSLSFSTLNWFVIRMFMIFLRKKFPEFKDTWKRIGLFMLAIVGSVTFIDFIGQSFFSFAVGVNFNNHSKIVLPIIIITTMTMAIYEALYYYIRLKKSVREEEQAKQAIIQAQLDALRNQAQPHFFFNTMNTLRDIIDQNSKEEAKDFVDKISDVYRFILESGNDNLISLKDELKFAKAYMHIQLERFGNNLEVNWNIADDYLESMVVPMSLQLLIENAIKHNIVSMSRPLLINVNVINEHLIVSNKIQAKSTKLPSTKLGLANIGKRYSLISENSIEIIDDGETFSVHLPLLNTSDQKKVYADTNH